MTASTPSLVAADGLHELPPGKVAAIATYLELTVRPTSPARRGDPGLTFEPLADDLPRYRRLYDEVGRPWLWFSRRALPDRDVAAILSHPRVEALAVCRDGREVGLVELDFRGVPDCELAFLGVVPDAIGQGLGRPLLDEALRRAFLRPIRRVWLHTCTLDHPAALRLYLGAGLRPYRRAVEVADDPRRTGIIPADAAPGFPVV